MKLEIKNNSFGTYILWIDDIPAFQFWKKSDIKDALTPSGWNAYMENKEKIDRWLAISPTLEGRLNQPITTEKEAIEQLVAIGGVELSEKARKILNENVV